jgi:hypothetical protein
VLLEPIEQMTTLLAIVVVCVTLGPALLGLAYRRWLRPEVCMHFGEEFPYRRDRDAARRRRTFERRCGMAVGFLYFSGMAGFIRGLVSDSLPQISTVGIIAQASLLLAAVLSGWAAFSRWQAPLLD